MKHSVMKNNFVSRPELSMKCSVQQVTSLPGSHHHLYFTSNSFSQDDENILFISDTSEGSNICKLSLNDGETRQLTTNSDGYLRSYVYYNGNIRKGIGKASVSYNPVKNLITYIWGDEVRLLDLTTEDEDTIGIIPQGFVTGYTHISHDGKYVCIPFIAEEAFDVGYDNTMQRIERKIDALSLESQVLVIDTEDRHSEILFSHKGWITHVQFHPEESNAILFNHEGSAVDQRIWLYRDGEMIKVRSQSTVDESVWICHELWSPDGSSIVYHGTQGKALSFVGRYDVREDKYCESMFPIGMTYYGHCTVGKNNHTLLTDGIVDARVINQLNVHWQNGLVHWEPVCLHNSSFCNQDVHPHPVYSHNGSKIIFSSDVHSEMGMSNVYVTDVDEQI